MKSPIDFRADQGQHMDRDQTYVIKKEVEQTLRSEFLFDYEQIDYLLDNHSVELIKSYAEDFEIDTLYHLLSPYRQKQQQNELIAVMKDPSASQYDLDKACETYGFIQHGNAFYSYQ